MFREIKFRAWDLDNNSWLNNIEVYAVLCAHQRGEKAIRYPLSQFTGLKDKNGVDIYEGDILQHYSFKDTIFQMMWDDCCNGWCHYSPKNKFVVIGNIYENPELLNKEVENV